MLTPQELFFVGLTIAGVLLARVDTHVLIGVLFILMAWWLLAKGIIPMFKAP